jgi:hypothetical protein
VSKESKFRIKSMGLNKKKNKKNRYMNLTALEAGKLIENLIIR